MLQLYFFVFVFQNLCVDFNDLFQMCFIQIVDVSFISEIVVVGGDVFFGVIDDFYQMICCFGKCSVVVGFVYVVIVVQLICWYCVMFSDNKFV